MPTILKYQSPHTKEPEFFELDEKKTPADAEFVHAIDKCNSLYLTTGKFPERMYKKEFTSVADEHEQKWFLELKAQPPIHNVRRGFPQGGPIPNGEPVAKREAAMAAQAHMLKVMMNVVGAAKKVQHAWSKPEPECFVALGAAKLELDQALNQFEEFMKALDQMGSKSGVAQFSGK